MSVYKQAWDTHPPREGDPEYSTYLEAREVERQRLADLAASIDPPGPPEELEHAPELPPDAEVDTRSAEDQVAGIVAVGDLARAKARLGAALPDHGWLYDYLRAVVPLTDAPVEFQLAAGLGALSAAIGNSMWVPSWGQRVYPHIWAVLVAPSSFWRKTTAINFAERLLRNAEDSRVLPSDFSREKLLEELQARPVGLLSIKEFGGFLANISRDYMSGTKEMLTELYDAPDRYVRALKAKSYTVERPAVTILGATTLDWLESRITEGDLRGGFLGRFLFVTAAEKSSPKQLTGEMDGLVQMHLQDGLRTLTKLEPHQAYLTPAGRQLLEAWIATWEDEVTSAHHSTDLTGFAVRLQTYALKLSMLFQASHAMGTEEPIDMVDVAAVASAIAYCRVLWRNVAGLVDDEIAIGKDAKELRRIRAMVGTGLTRSQLLKLSKMAARDFDKYLDTLVQTGELTRQRVKASEVGLARAKDRFLEWVEPRDSLRSSSRHGELNGGGPVHSVHREPKGSESMGEWKGTESTDSTLPVLSSQFSLSHQHTSRDLRAREEPGTEPDPPEDLDFG